MTLEIFHKSWYSMTNKSSRTNEHFFPFGIIRTIIRTRVQYEQICMYRSKQSKSKMFKLVQMIKTSSQKQISFLIQYYSLYPRSYSAIIRTFPFKASWNYCKYWIKIPFWKMNPLEDFVNSVILDKIWIYFPELRCGQNPQVDSFSKMEFLLRK